MAARCAVQAYGNNQMFQVQSQLMRSDSKNPQLILFKPNMLRQADLLVCAMLLAYQTITYCTIANSWIPKTIIITITTIL